MTLPQHKNPTAEERTARAPYNFVPLPESVVTAGDLPRRDRYDSDLHTGTIRCTLTTETPLYTRAALEPEEYGYREAKEKPDSFYVDPVTKEPVIPGSTLRGMLRTLMEIVTYSKLQPVTDRQLFFRTLDDTSLGRAYGRRMSGGDPRTRGYYPLASAGYMERRGYSYFIRPAQEIEGTQFYRVREQIALKAVPGLRDMARQRGDGRWSPNRQYQWMRRPVWFRPVPARSHLPDSPTYYADIEEMSVENMSAEAGWQQGWFIASGWVPSRQGAGKLRHWIVGPPTEDDEGLIALNDMDIEAYDELGAGLSQAIKKERMSVLPSSNGEQIPCFYTFWQDSQGRQRVAFGHTAMFRLPYEWSPRDLLPDYLKEGSSVTDMAEALLGWVDTAKGLQIAGRVTVGDARLTAAPDGMFELQDSEEPIPVLLSGPKPTTFQHYLTQDTDRKDELRHYQGMGETTLRGHKLYWHKNEGLRRSDYGDGNASPDSTQHTYLRPIKAGVSFSFDICFENLADVELGALLWVLIVCGSGKHRLKVGMAKPLGLGTVRVSADLRCSNRLERYRDLMAEWNQQTAKTDEKEQFVQAFEATMMKMLPVQARQGAKSFRRLERIKMLLALLSWPGPADTDYMGLGEFRRRPVLPDPETVLQTSAPAAVKPPPRPHAPKPVVEATVVRLEGSYLEIDVEGERVNLQFDRLPDPGYDQEDRKRLYPEGKKIRVRTLGRSKKDKLRVTGKDVPQDK